MLRDFLAVLAVATVAQAASRSLVVTDLQGHLLAEAQIARTSGLAATSTDSDGVAILGSNASTGIEVRRAGRGDLRRKRIVHQDGHLGVRIDGFDLAGRAPGRSAASLPKGRVAEALARAADTASGDSLLVGWNGVVRQRVVLTQSRTTVAIDTAKGQGELLWNDSLTANRFRDPRDGQVYRTVQIGAKRWMAQNLAWNAPGSRLYEDDASMGIRYGRWYSWASAMGLDDSCNQDASCQDLPALRRQGACPAGWHLPDDSEWIQLGMDVGGLEMAGTKLKAVTVQIDQFQANGHPILQSADPYGFRADFAGWCWSDGMCQSAEAGAAWWATGTVVLDGSSYQGYGTGKVRTLDYMNNSLMESSFYKAHFLSVRCVAD